MPIDLVSFYSHAPSRLLGCPRSSDQKRSIMDINFKCSNCDQDLTIDDSGAGSEIQCPSCNATIVIPSDAPAAAAEAEGEDENEAPALPKIINPISTSAAAKEIKHFAVPQRDKAPDPLIAKPLKPLDAAAHEGIILRVKCIRHFDCVEVGKDHFDEFVTNFLTKIGEPNIVKIETFNYAHRDLETRDWVTDYGVFILYKG